MFSAEDRLQALYLVCDLVGEYVERSGFREWPRLWADLERMPPREWSRFQWPRDSAEVERLVIVDFGARLDDLRTQAPERFVAVRMSPGKMRFGSAPAGLLLERLKAGLGR